jgi:hypothetical protein
MAKPDTLSMVTRIVGSASASCAVNNLRRGDCRSPSNPPYSRNAAPTFEAILNAMPRYRRISSRISAVTDSLQRPTRSTEAAHNERASSFVGLGAWRRSVRQFCPGARAWP